VTTSQPHPALKHSSSCSWWKHGCKLSASYLQRRWHLLQPSCTDLA
jgi:hypothetical protein